MMRFWWHVADDQSVRFQLFDFSYINLMEEAPTVQAAVFTIAEPISWSLSGVGCRGRTYLCPAASSQFVLGLLEFNSNIFSLMRRFSQSGPQFGVICVLISIDFLNPLSLFVFEFAGPVFSLDLVALLFPWLPHSPVFPFSLDCVWVSSLSLSVSCGFLRFCYLLVTEWEC